MSEVPALRPESGGLGHVRAAARFREIDRQLGALRIRKVLLEWLALPLMAAALVAMVVGLVLGVGPAGPVLGGVVALAGAVGGFVSMARRVREDMEELRAEREERGG